MSFLRIVKDGDNEYFALAERLRVDTGLDFEVACVDDQVRLSLSAPSGTYWYIELERADMDQEGAYWVVRQHLSLPLDGALQAILEEVGYSEDPPNMKTTLWALIGVIVILVVILGIVLL